MKIKKNKFLLFFASLSVSVLSLTSNASCPPMANSFTGTWAGKLVAHYSPDKTPGNIQCTCRLKVVIDSDSSATFTFSHSKKVDHAQPSCDRIYSICNGHAIHHPIKFPDRLRPFYFLLSLDPKHPETANYSSPYNLVYEFWPTPNKNNRLTASKTLFIHRPEGVVAIDITLNRQ